MVRHARWSRVGLAVSTAAILALFGCSRDKDTTSTVTVANDAPSYCQALSTLPTDLTDAMTDALIGSATTYDKNLLGDVAGKLSGAGKTAPSELQKQITPAATVLTKLSKGESLTDDESKNIGTTFENLQKGVEAACAAK
jgi:hypothetical protein